MEFIRKNIHMDWVKCRANAQVSLEDDVNVPDRNPDVGQLVLDRGNVEIDEVRAMADHVHVKGQLQFAVLYLSEESDKSLYCMEGQLPFEEQIFMEQVSGTDNVQVKAELEDLSISLINSRKISVQALLNLQAQADSLYDEEVCVEAVGTEQTEYHKKQVPMCCLAIQKRDILRIREEAQLPQSLPNIQNIIWHDCRLQEISCKGMDGRLTVQGEAELFLLYEPEGEEASVRWYEVVLPVNGSVDCQSMREDMITRIGWEMGPCQVEVKGDMDGEMRNIGLELAMNLSIQAYEEETVDMITDMYGVTKEVTPIKKDMAYRVLLVKNRGLVKAAGKMKVQPGEPHILQLCHGQGQVTVDEMAAVENGIRIVGSVQVQALYVTAEDELPFYSLRGSIPVNYLLEVPDMEADCTYYVHPMLEQLSVTMTDGGELEAKAAVGFDALVFGNRKESMLQDVTISELDYEKMKGMPSIAVYVAREGDTLWDIGKRYYVTVDSLKEMNHLTGEELKAGDQLLVVK